MNDSRFTFDPALIKGVASDIDGTLLPSGQPVVSPEIADLLKKVTDSGRFLCLASGRPLKSLMQQAVYQEGVMYICTNGTLVVKDNEVLLEDAIPREEAKKIIAFCQKLENCEVLVSCKDHCYISPHKPGFYESLMEKGYPVIRLEDLTELPENALEISINRIDGILKTAPEVMDAWGDTYNVVVSGLKWMDIIMPGASKGEGIRKVMEITGTSRDEWVSLGDSYNDIPMFEVTTHSVCMEIANDDVKEKANNVSTAEKTLTYLLQS